MNDRNHSLDVLRGIAVLLVIFCHYPIIPLMAVGGFGVDLFFVLSGFLISGLLFSDLIQNGAISIRRFYIRRGFKIYPPFYFLFIATLLFGLHKGSASQWLSEGLFLQSYRQHIWAHTWSLAVEEHFYIFLPLLLIALAKAGRMHWIPKIAVGLIAFCFFARIATAAFNPAITIYSTHDRLDELFAGVALGYLYNFQRGRFIAASRWWTLPLGILLLAPAIFLPQRTVIEITPVLAMNVVGFGLLVLWAVPRAYVRCGWLEIIGRYSYSIYLWHYPICLLWKTRPMSAIGFVSYVLIALAIGIAAAIAVEKPVLAFRDAAFPSRHNGHGTAFKEHAMPVEDAVLGREELVRVNV